MFVRKAIWLLSFVQLHITVDAGFWDTGDESDVVESQATPIGKVEYGVDMVRLQCVSYFITD